ELVQRAVRTQSVICEKRRISCSRPNEIVAAVVGWSHHDVMRGQGIKRLFENRTWQMWAVAVESDGSLCMIPGEVRKTRSEPCRKTFSLLRHHIYFAAC